MAKFKPKSKIKPSIIKKLELVGLKPQEAAVYVACLKLGETTANALAETTGIQRTYIYDIVEDLASKGLLSMFELKEGVRHYSAVSLEQFRKIQEEKWHEFEKVLPEMRALVKTTGEEPQVKFFQGKDGLKAAYQDILDSVSNTEILAYATGEGFYEEEPEFQLNYIQSRVRQKIRVRAIAADLPSTRAYTAHDKAQMRQTRLVPADKFPFANEIDIYANKVAIMNLEDEYLAVIIESEGIARTQRSIFELAWLGAEKL